MFSQMGQSMLDQAAKIEMETNMIRERFYSHHSRYRERLKKLLQDEMF
ncbi:hypothetical protein [Bacillus sp. FJAT-28004]|nr:hypothetical protein [Bacillus sp. FJAT-28004]